MEREQLRNNALDNELELAAVAEAQVAQAEGLLQVADAITQAQTRFTKAVCWATGLGVSISIIGICSFLYWQTHNVRRAAEIALPRLEADNHAQKVAILENIDWDAPPSAAAIDIHEHLDQASKERLDRMIKAMKTDPEAWIHFIESSDQ